MGLIRPWGLRSGVLGFGLCTPPPNYHGTWGLKKGNRFGLKDVEVMQILRGDVGFSLSPDTHPRLV